MHIINILCLVNLNMPCAFSAWGISRFLNAVVLTPSSDYAQYQGAIDGELALPGLEELPSLRCESRRVLEKQLCNHASCAEHVHRPIDHPSSCPTLFHVAIASPLNLEWAMTLATWSLLRTTAIAFFT
ncbi:hypothetical protein FIBSPDRAFT_866261, partial [Athelia psychrophila]